ncbi:unnamed protein product [Candidula unifasciata]|uniref:PX domain-containing protein n=1 Tax=Candidula unifasciata TaxID=100452 RepID=A0A8S3YRS3_9EUPU|nr:unnamed protein product [Candidula unifasciata]
MSEFTETDSQLASVNVTGAALPNTGESSNIWKETISDGIEFAENCVISEQPVSNTDISWQSDDTFKNQESKFDDKREVCGRSVDKLPSGLTTSAVVINKEVPVDCSIDSDTTPLLNERHSSLSSCTDVTTEGETSEASCDCSYLGSRDSDSSSSNTMLTASQARENLMVPGSIRVPIVGHETLESRSKFTVFKIHVMIEDDKAGWFIFRRYTDFVHLNDQLTRLFPNFRLALPPKRWFRNNFDVEFLDERVLGLQAFVDNVTGHRDICKSKPVRDFFCFDDPPGPYDSLEESRAQCESMEEVLYSLREEVNEKDKEIDILKEELDLYKNQVQLLTNRLSELSRRTSFETSDKHRSPHGDRKINIDALLHSGEKLITNKLNTVSELK